MPPVLELPDLSIKSIEYHENIYINAAINAKPECPRCQSSHIYIKDSFQRQINHSRLGNQNIKVRFTSYKYQCQSCDKYFNLKLQGLLGKHNLAKLIS